MECDPVAYIPTILPGFHLFDVSSFSLGPCDQVRLQGKSLQNIRSIKDLRVIYLLLRLRLHLVISSKLFEGHAGGVSYVVPNHLHFEKFESNEVSYLTLKELTRC